MQGMTSAKTEINQVLYARDADGSYPVHIKPTSFSLIKPTGIEKYTSKRQLLIAITGHPKARNWTFDRYFHTGNYDKPNPVRAEPDPQFIDFGWFKSDSQWITPVKGKVPGTKVQTSVAISVSEATAASLAVKATASLGVDGIVLGIDLVNRSSEVAKLLFKGFGPWIYSAGYDPEDVLQEVYRGLLVRNIGKCPWDARKSSFGHYVHMVCNGVVSNFHRKRKRIRECETTGTYAYNDAGDWTMTDVASSNLPAPIEGDVLRNDTLEVTEDLLAYMPKDSAVHLARRVLPLLRDGYTRTDIARLLGVSRTLVMTAVVELQTWAKQWYAQAI